MNWTLEDFYAGNKVAVKINRFSDREVDDLYRLTKGLGKGNFSYYWYNDNGYIGMGMDTKLPFMSLSYFISLLDAQEAKQRATTEPEYIYEPFDEEAAKDGAVVVLQKSKKVVEFKFYHGKSAWIIVEGNVCAYNPNTLRIRRTIETKEVECYVYENGYISSLRNSGSPYIKIIDTFTHTIKIPKK